MPIRSLNHAVLYVSDVHRSVDFYCRILRFEKLPTDFPGGAFLRGTGSANEHDLGLFQASAPRTADGAVGLYHLAWEVDSLRELSEVRDRLAQAGALTGAANHAGTKALYGRDPDGIEFEVTWLVPDSLLETEVVPGVEFTRPLDIDAEIERYGADTPGGPRSDLELMERVMRRLAERG
ncbi:VOC family protein [Rhodococcoides fascians A25f]|uniref:VOC family protein n=1 Tax=Rhodococcoides fascians TaxID=1828 RepID=UPI00055F6775|nr:VOC family protein [Rhodococcus fascians]QII07379.1 VOC family protein [Rhodococcus fascians A25f]